MPISLRIHALRLRATAEQPIELEAQPGSAIRGALYNALLRRFCMNPAATTCLECPLNQSCPVAGLVAPLRDERPRGRDVPRPFVLAATLPAPSSADQDRSAAAISSAASPGQVAPAPLPAGIRLAPSQQFEIHLTLIGRAISFFPYVALSVPALEAAGLGRPLHANGGRRGRFHLNAIDLVDPFDPAGDRAQRLYTRGTSQVAAPRLVMTAHDVAGRAVKLAADHLTLNFLTPTRLIADGKLAHSPGFRVLALRLAERIEALEREYGGAASAEDGEDALPSEWWRERSRHIEDLAEAVRLVADETHWVDVASYSARQGRATPIGGIVGRATYAGDLVAELRELLTWGELLHVGKNTVKGDGRYRIEP